MISYLNDGLATMKDWDWQYEMNFNANPSNKVQNIFS